MNREYSDDPTLGLVKKLGIDYSLYVDDEIRAIDEAFKDVEKYLTTPKNTLDFKKRIENIYFEIASRRVGELKNELPSLVEIVDDIDDFNFDILDTFLCSKDYGLDFIEDVKMRYIMEYSQSLSDKVENHLIEMGLMFAQRTVCEVDLLFEKIGVDQIVLNPEFLYEDFFRRRKLNGREKFKAITP